MVASYIKNIARTQIINKFPNAPISSIRW